jgi:hypothetical protein
MDGRFEDFMTTGYSRSPKLLKGAIIQFSAPLFVPIPNIVVFQYNPESMTRSLTPWAPPTNEQTKNDPKVEDNLAQPYDPVETFNVTLELDAADDLENALAHPVTVVSGIADRIAALETLLYPSVSSLPAGSISVSLNVGAGGLSASASVATVKAERLQVPIILFFFGPGRIVPVRITTFSVDEQAYSPLLYPLRAKVSLGLKVLDPTSLTDDGSAAYKIAVGCYKYTQTQKKALATIRIAENAVDGIMSLLPF